MHDGHKNAHDTDEILAAQAQLAAERPSVGKDLETVLLTTTMGAAISSGYWIFHQKPTPDWADMLIWGGIAGAVTGLVYNFCNIAYHAYRDRR